MWRIRHTTTTRFSFSNWRQHGLPASRQIWGPVNRCRPVTAHLSTEAMSRRFYPLGLDTNEDIEGYRPGGFHPVHLEDTLGERYKILHKLGSGGLSTTWLARDTVGNRYQALKILKAEETAASTELRTLEKLAAIQSDDRGKQHIRYPNAHFVIQGPNGQHICLVTDVSGPSLSGLYNVIGHGYAAGSRRLRIDLARTAMRQVVEAVNFLHAQHICHGGRHTCIDEQVLTADNDHRSDFAKRTTEIETNR